MLKFTLKKGSYFPINLSSLNKNTNKIPELHTYTVTAVLYLCVCKSFYATTDYRLMS